MRRRTLREAVLVRLGGNRADDRGSLPMLILVIITTVALGAIMMSTMLTASKTSEYVQTRVTALNAAQSGIDAVVGQLRAAESASDTTIGDAGRLPCGPFTSGATTTGPNANAGQLPAASDGSTASYSVTIAYYDVDPNTLGAADLRYTTAQTDPTTGGQAPQAGHQMLCTSNGGPYNTKSGVRTPKYALLTSTGSISGGRPATRTVQTTYNFQVLNQNIAGGTIRIYPASATQTTQWCMDAGSNPAVGTAITLQACSTSNPPIAQQVWEYRSDLSIELASTVTNPKSAGLCLDTGLNPAAHKANDPIVLERCAVADASVCPPGTTSNCSVSPWNQQWSVDNAAHLEGAKTDQSDIDNMCINAATQTAGTALNLQTCAGSVTDPKQTWVPSPTAGAGMASAGNNQLVNFQQFATCLDDTGGDLNATYMILYTCKQNPNPNNVLYNQKFIPSQPLPPCPSTKQGVATDCSPQTVLITVVTGGNTYCLKSPLVAGQYPTLVQQGTGVGQCPSSVSANSTSPFAWVMNRRYSDVAGKVDLPYATKYTIVDSSGLCLGPGSNSDLLNGAYSKAVVGQCTGDNSQKWNADPFTVQSNLSNTTEITGSSGN